ncbi:shieldin complex subunit 1-like isoform X2 [Hyla sarda]|nr:shieldin complex subunit 1-like isoform X2 [Hyla sarda]XP_056423789.1 shieldin complex subunit 1-like isoform X2 [Hyla sarda]XP_056423790.1 shieldin complex subunit 1-like isoform X2 [Hyla sarda]XP_056423791.1 shieldin complex subunit 1-like isoform X2 [Hyla sarda]XP_056423792.1 shieldin complex subunit 1-like isoform X2 [Hyla sarda]XP_056423793.1 shieldin complex subunit 1-like isoform X2 [Hyla sarda]
MNSADGTPSQTSDCSSVVDLSCTYNISQSVFVQDLSPRSWEEEFSSTVTSASSLKNTGLRKNSCDNNEEQQLEDENSQLVPQSSDAFTVTQQSAATLNSFHKLETTQGRNDVRIATSLDAFYKQSSWSVKKDTLSDQLSEKISDLSRKQHLYALRSFQLGKIVLNQEGEKILQNCSSNSFFSPEQNKNTTPVPGLSKDVVSFIMDQKKKDPPPHPMTDP